MAERTLAIRVIAEGAAKAAGLIKDVDKSVTGLGNRVKSIAGGAKSSILQGVGLGIGSAAYQTFNQAVGASIDFLTGSIQAAADEEASIASLTAALKANIAGWNGSTDAINARIDAGAKLAFSDDDMRASLTILVGATKDVNKAFDVQSVAMDLARYKHISLTDASEALIRVENGQYRLLKSLGIQLPKNATAVDALAAVEKVAGGQAQAFASTTQGSFDQLGIATHNLQEDIGKGLAPAAEDLAKGIQNYGIPAVHGLMDVLGGLGDVARAIAGPLGAIPDFIGFIADGARTALAPLGNLNDALGGLGDLAFRGGKPPTPNSTPPAPIDYAPPTNPGTGSGGPPSHHRASGGPVTAGVAYRVGEFGAETFVPSTSGTIIPNGGMGSLTLNVTVSVPASDVSRGLNQRQRTVKPHGPRGALVTG